MATMYLMFFVFMWAAILAPTVILYGLQLATEPQNRPRSKALFAWAAVGAIAFSALDVVLGELLWRPASFGGATIGAASGFTMLAVAALAIRRWLKRGNNKGQGDFRS